MAVGGVGSDASLQYLQQSQKLSNQNMQLQQQNADQTNQTIVRRAASNTVQNQQSSVSAIQNSLRRGQALDLYA